MTSEGTLFIKNAVPKDAGTYSCLASNEAGTDEQTSTLRYIGEYTQVMRQWEWGEHYCKQRESPSRSVMLETSCTQYCNL